MLNFDDLKQLVEPQYQNLLRLYCRFWNLGWQHFYAPEITTEIKHEQIKLLAKALRKNFPLEGNILRQLQDFFVCENLSVHLLSDLLPGWRYLANNKALTSQSQLCDIISELASAPARLIMVLNNETPSSYLPMEAILTAMIFHKLTEKRTRLTEKLKLSKKQKNAVIKGLLKDGAVILQIVKSKRLKFKSAMFLNKQKFLLLNNKQEKITLLDATKIFLYSIYQFLIVRRHTIERKGY